jgi:hypothetical protein
MNRLTLDDNEREALISALDNYLNGCGIDDGDEDEETLDRILDRLSTNLD